MNPADLIGKASELGYPAPFWFLLFFKSLGFLLHMLPMHLWYAGVPAAMLLRRSPGYPSVFSRRLMQQMPFIVAYGINLGIVPLLFLQVAYHRAFYPASILSAWPWLSIVLFLMLAYYGVYLYAIGLKMNQPRMLRIGVAAGWLSALCFLVMGFLFSNTMSLMTNVSAWPGLWQSTGVAGAVLGTAFNWADATLYPRWLMVFAQALTTLAVYMYFDAALFAQRESEGYRHWAALSSFRLYLLGALCFMLTAAWYAYTLSIDGRMALMLEGLRGVITIATAASLLLPLGALALLRHRLSPMSAYVLLAAQVVMLGLNAWTRQSLQNIELAPYLNVAAEPVNLQLSPLILFLLLFVAGLVVTIWMVAKVRAVVVAETASLKGPTI